MVLTPEERKEIRESQRLIGKRAYQALQESLGANGAGLRELAEVIAAGLRAEETKFFSDKGEVIDERTVINFGERRKYAELAVAIYGAKAPDKIELEGRIGPAFTDEEREMVRKVARETVKQIRHADDSPTD